MRISVAFACALALQTAAWPQESPGALIEYLGHADPDVRVVAERRLLALGAAAHPALREAFDHRDAEVRRRARRLLPRSLRRIDLDVWREALALAERKEQPLWLSAWGIHARPASYSESLHLRFTQWDGAVVTEVAPDSMAMRLSIEPGDVILEVNGRRLLGLTQDSAPWMHEDVVVKLVRAGRTQYIDVHARLRRARKSRGAGTLETRSPGSMRVLGMELRAASPLLARHLALEGTDGVLVLWTTPGSLGQRIGLRPCDVILELDGAPLRDPAPLQALAELRDGKKVRLRVLRRGRQEVIVYAPERGRRQTGPPSAAAHLRRALSELPRPEGGILGGRVLQVKGRLVLLSVGTADGVRIGDEVHLDRDGRRVGTITITKAERDAAVGRAGGNGFPPLRGDRAYWLKRVAEPVLGRVRACFPLRGVPLVPDGLALKVKEGHVTISTGAKDGLALGDELHVSRGERYVGTIRITKIWRDKAVGRTTDVKGSAFPPKLKDRVYAR